MRPRLALPILIFILTVVVTVVACAQAADRPVPPTATSGAAAFVEPVAGATSAGAKTSADPASSADALTPLAETIVTIAGVVGSVDANEKLLRLDGQNEGFSAIRLTLATRVVREDGKDGSFADLRAGQIVQAKGLPGKDGAIIARQVTISHGY